MTTIPTHLVCDSDHIERHAERITQAPALGLDTEFVRERTWYPRPGLLQICDGHEVWLIDPIALADDPRFAHWLAGLLAGPQTKILHSAGEDFEVFDLLAGRKPWPLFDTQRAAALLGWPLQMRLETLAGELLGIELPGGLGRNDWTRRPLPEAWLRYAADDVTALTAMRDRLSEQLAERGRLDWLIEDCRRMIAHSDDEPPAVVRVKGAAGLDDPVLERLSRLAEWRDHTARASDLPRAFVVRDEALVELARHARVTNEVRVPRRHRDAIDRVLADPPQEFVRPPELAPLTADQRSRIKALQAEVRTLATALEIEPAVLASRRDLTRLVQGATCNWASGWRAEVLAPVLESAKGNAH